MKFGGSSLRDSKSISHTASIIKENSFSNRIVVVSAVFGVTNILEKAVIGSLENEPVSKINRLKELHHDLADNLISDKDLCSRVKRDMDSILDRTAKMLKGVFYTREATPRIKDAVLSTGERLSAILMAGCLKNIGVNATAVESDQIGMVTEGMWGNGTVAINEARKNMRPFFQKLFKDGTLPVVTGFFGSTRSGDAITFGRGGSDYSAAVFARVLKASYLEIWKDVKGFLTGAPNNVTKARLISALSYEEAAELAYFGAKILHPRTVEPLTDKGIPIVIRSTFYPESPGTWIGPDAYISKEIVKSVTYDRNVALIRAYGANIGYAVNLLSEMVSGLSSASINIRSVFTSQTYINILLNETDLITGFDVLSEKNISGIDELEKAANLGLIAIVGHGIADAKEVVSRAFSSLTEKGIDVDLVLSGASRVASYFLVKEEMLSEAVSIIHNNFFSSND